MVDCMLYSIVCIRRYWSIVLFAVQGSKLLWSHAGRISLGEIIGVSSKPPNTFSRVVRPNGT